MVNMVDAKGGAGTGGSGGGRSGILLEPVGAGNGPTNNKIQGKWIAQYGSRR